MPRKATGQLYENKGKRGTTYGLRFRLADGRRVYEKLGQDYGPDPITRKDAQARADRLLAQVRLGQYRTKEERAADRRAREAENESPLFAPFADEWLDRRRILGGRRGKGLSESGENDLQWRLAHLTAWFGGMRLDEITEEEVERYATAKRAAPIREGGLGATSTNKTLSTLEAIFKVAVRYRRVDRNPVDGYRVPADKYVAVILESPAQAVALLEAAEAQDRLRRGRRGHGRVLLATLLFGGLRIGEALALTWRDVNLATGTLRVRKGKTEAAARTVDLLPPLREALAELKARRDPDRDDLVFANSRGNTESRSNVTRRVLAPAITAANKKLEAAEEELIPEAGDEDGNGAGRKLTLHGLRHTHVSVALATGTEAGYVADQVGHTDAGFTYKRYRKAVKRHAGELDRWRALFHGEPMSPPESASAAHAAA